MLRFVSFNRLVKHVTVGAKRVTTGEGLIDDSKLKHSSSKCRPDLATAIAGRSVRDGYND